MYSWLFGVIISWWYLPKQTFSAEKLILFICILKNIDHDSLPSFDRTENQLFRFPSQLTRMKTNALEREKTPLYPLSASNQAVAHLFAEDCYQEAEATEKEKVSVLVSLTKAVERNCSGVQVGDAIHSTHASGAAWWSVLCCAMGKCWLILYCILKPLEIPF